MKRKTFLQITAGFVTIGAAFGTYKVFLTSFEDSVANLLFNQLSFLILEKNGVRQFARDYSKQLPASSRLLIKAYGIAGIDAGHSLRIHALINTYLLSTDFGMNGMDESKEIKYLGLYNPYLRPCSHPFSHLQYPSS